MSNNVLGEDVCLKCGLGSCVLKFEWSLLSCIIISLVPAIIARYLCERMDRVMVLISRMTFSQISSPPPHHGNNSTGRSSSLSRSACNYKVYENTISPDPVSLLHSHAVLASLLVSMQTGCRFHKQVAYSTPSLLCCVEF